MRSEVQGQWGGPVSGSKHAMHSSTCSSTIAKALMASLG
jgi:hypothetical protein